MTGKNTHWVVHKLFYLHSLYITSGLGYKNIFFWIFRTFIFFLVRHLAKCLIVYTTGQEYPQALLVSRPLPRRPQLWTRDQRLKLWMENGRQSFGSNGRMCCDCCSSLYTSRGEENWIQQEGSFRYIYI